MPGMVPVRLRTPSGRTAVFYASTAGSSGPHAGSVAPPPVEVASSETSSSGKVALEEQRPGTAEWATATPTHESEIVSEILRVESPSEEHISSQMGSDEAVHDTAQCDYGSSVLQSFVVGDVVYRNGELASVVHVDATLDPPSYVVRIAQSGHEVSCEGRHLSLAFSRSSDTSPSTTVPDSDELNHASTEVAQTTFADIVQMQTANLSQAPLTEHLQQQQQLQMQLLQMQQMQQLQHMNIQPEQLQQMQLQQMQQLWSEQAHLPTGNAYEPTPEQLQQIYEAAAAAAQRGVYYDSQHMANIPGPSFDSYPRALQQPQECSHPQFEHPPFTSQPVFGSGGFGSGGSSHENHALKAVAEALDRAEINMLSGGRQRCSSPPGLNLGGDMDSSQFGRYPADSTRAGSSTNFALQAASDMLTGGRRNCSSPLGLNLAGEMDSSNFLARPIDAPRGLGSTNFALQAAADALGKMDQGSSLVGRLGGGPNIDSRGAAQDFRFDTELSHVEQSFPSHARAIDGNVSQPHAMHAGAREDHRTQLESLLSSELIPTSVAQFQSDRESQPDRSVLPQTEACTSFVEASSNHALITPGAFAGKMASYVYEDDDELELMARKEMEEDDPINFSARLPPKPPKLEDMHLPGPPIPALPGCGAAQTHPTLPTQPTPAMPPQPPPQPPRRQSGAFTPTSAPQPIRAPVVANARSRSKDRFGERDALVDFILSDAPSKRSTTPFGSKRSTTPLGSRNSSGRNTPRLPDGRSTPRSDVRSTSIPMAAHCRSSSRGPSMRSKSPHVFFPEEQHGKASPRKSWSGKAAPHMLDFVHFDGLFDAGSKPKGKAVNLDDSSPDSSVSSLPRLSDKRSSQRQKDQVPKSARSWRENAVSMYA